MIVNHVTMVKSSNQIYELSAAVYQRMCIELYAWLTIFSDEITLFLGISLVIIICPCNNSCSTFRNCYSLFGTIILQVGKKIIKSIFNFPICLYSDCTTVSIIHTEVDPWGIFSWIKIKIVCSLACINKKWCRNLFDYSNMTFLLKHYLSMFAMAFVSNCLSKGEQPSMLVSRLWLKGCCCWILQVSCKML